MIKTGLDMASVTKSLKDFDKHLKDMQELANKNVVKIKMDNVNSQLNQTRQGFEGINNQTRSFTENMGYAIKKVGTFATAFGLVYGAVRELKSGINEIININKSNTNMAMVMNKPISDVEKLNKGLMQTAKNLGVVFSEAQNGFEAWNRSGAGLQESNKNLETTTKLAKIAGVSNSEMADSLITINKQFELGSEGLENYASHVALLDNASTTTSEKINTAMQYSAETFKEYGFEVDEALSLVTNASERSARSGSSIGRGFVSMLTNFTKVQESVKNGSKEETDAINKAELLMSQKGITLRKDADNFRNLNDVIKDISSNIDKFSQKDKEFLAFNLGGKENKELFLSIINNMENIEKLNQKLKEDTGAKALNDSYQKYMDSIEFRTSNLKNKVTEFWMNLINSNTIKSAVSGLTEIVKVIQYITVENKGLGVTILATGASILLITKHMGTLKFAIGEVTAFMSLLKTEGLATLAVLEFNPVILALTAVVAGVALVTKNLYENSQKAKELKSDYESLSKAMGEMDGEGIKQNIGKLKEQQKELDKLKKMSEIKMDMGFGVKDESGQKKLEKYIDTLKEAGFTVDRNTNKIIELAQAESNIATSDKIKSIQDKTNKIIEESSETQNLIQQYQSLSQQENLSAEKKALLSGLTQQLVGRVDGLTTSVDSHGNMVINNTKLLGNQIDALELLKLQAVSTGNVEMEMAINTAQVISNGTIQTLDDMKKKLEGYQALSSALSNSKAGQGGFFSTELYALKMGSETLQGSISKLESLKSKSKMKMPTINTTSDNGGGYKPSSNSDSDRNANAKNKTDKQDIENLEIKNDRYYKLEGTLKSVNEEIERNNKLEANANEKDKLAFKEKEISLLDQKKIALQNIYKAEQTEGRELSSKLLSKGFKFDSTTGQIANKNELLSSMTSNANKLHGKAKEDAIKSIKETEEIINSYEDLRFNKLSDTSSKIFDLEQDRISKLKDIETEKFDKKLENIDKTYGQESEQISSIKYKLEEINASDDDSKETIEQKVKLTEDLIKATEDYNVKLLTGYGESLDLLNSTEKGTAEWERANQQVEDFKGKLKSGNIELANLNKSLEDISKEKLNKIQEMQDKIGQVITKSYEEEKQTALDTISDIQDARDDSHKRIIDNLNEEKKANEDIFNEKLSQIDREENAKDYTDSSSKLLNEKTDLQKQYDLLSLDSSREALIKREEIAKQIADKQAEIDKLSHDRSTDLRKQNIQDELSDYQKMMESKIDDINTAYESEKETLEKRKVDIEDYYNNKLKQSNIFIESQEALEKGYIDRIKKQVVNGFLVEVGNESMKLDTALTTYLDNYENGLSVTGGLIKTELIDNLKIVLDLVSELKSNNGDIKIGNTNIKTPLSNNIPNLSNAMLPNVQGLIANIPNLIANISMPKFNIPNFSNLGNNKNSNIKIDNLIKVDGNVDKNVVADLQKVGQDTANRLAKLLKESGH